MRDVSRALVAVVVAVVSACMGIDFEPGLDGSGVAKSETRDVSGFDRVAVEDDFVVEVTVGPAASLSLTGDDNLLPHVRTEVRGGTLHVEDARELDPTETIRVRITIPMLRGLASSGSSGVRATGIRSDAFGASVSGSGEMVADGDFGDLDVTISGSGMIRLQGTADEIDGSVSGSADLDLARVAARRATVRVSGSGDVVVQVTESLDAEVSGSGDVRYLGTPRVEARTSGSGSVHRAQPEGDR
jgi:hypothetical protein